VTATPCDLPSTPEFLFTFNLLRAEKIYIIPMKSLQCALDANRDSPLGMGSEFRKIPTIKQIFQHHPIWPRMKRILTNGLHWPLEHINKELQIADLNKAIKFGNHKGASNNPSLLRKLVEKDVKYGYCITPPLRIAKLIPDLLFA
jgi:hypothetical protein